MANPVTTPPQGGATVTPPKPTEPASLAKPQRSDPLTYAGSELSETAKRAIAARAADDLKGEIEIASEGIRLDPDDGLLYVIRGLAYAGLGMCEDALKDLRRAKDFTFTRPVTWGIHYGIAVCTESQNTKIDEASAGIALFPDHPDLYGLRASAYMMKSRLKEAIADIDQAIILDDTDPDLFAFRGALHCLDGDKQTGSVDVYRARDMAAGDARKLASIENYAKACEQ
jgi:tetratricopeptide (TPR) repeat protein